MRLQGKVAVITGMGSGIGLAMATRFAAEYARVVAGDWNAARLDAAIENFRRGGVRRERGVLTEPLLPATLGTPLAHIRPK